MLGARGVDGGSASTGPGRPPVASSSSNGSILWMFGRGFSLPLHPLGIHALLEVDVIVRVAN
eukprot:6240291-Heterocapsa_arctica.AAC.1